MALVCFEHTGFYSLGLSVYLQEKDITFAMVAALELKRSMGISRGKNDRVDAQRIAVYAYLHREKLRPIRLPGKAILQLQPLLALRDRLVLWSGGLLRHLRRGGVTFSCPASRRASRMPTPT